jgi:hypothetical protein
VKAGYRSYGTNPAAYVNNVEFVLDYGLLFAERVADQHLFLSFPFPTANFPTIPNGVSTRQSFSQEYPGRPFVALHRCDSTLNDEGPRSTGFPSQLTSTPVTEGSNGAS